MEFNFDEDFVMLGSIGFGPAILDLPMEQPEEIHNTDGPALEPITLQSTLEDNDVEMTLVNPSELHNDFKQSVVGFFL